MEKPALDLKRMNDIIQKTIETINEGKEEIFDIAENSRKEYERINNELTGLQSKVSLLILESEMLEKEEKRTRARLMIVSKDFTGHSEDNIRLSYEEANNARIQHILKKQEEKEYIKKRTELEMNLRTTYEIVKKAEKLVSRVGVAMDFLKGNLSDIFETIEDMNKRQLLGIRIIEAQEDERSRVSREIHDGPAQSMANVVLKAEICEKLLSVDIDQSREELRNLKSVVRDSLKDIRKIIYDLRPMSLDDLGLIPTVQRYVDSFAEETGMNIEFMVLSDHNNFDSIIEIACFRIIQESLNNIAKHSKAQNVFIKIEQKYNKISIIIKDNGTGFELDNLNSNEKDSGFGIIGMKERAELLGGRLEIKSALGEGTKILLIIPLEGKDELYER